MSTTLYNGIVLPDSWPPRTIDPASSYPMRVPYLEAPPAVIPIDIGRQLLVDDFLLEHSTLSRVYHHPVKDPANPVFFPQPGPECDPAYPPCAVAKCGGVWYDDRDARFKMWYLAGYLGAEAYAESDDGLHWRRPALDIEPGTNLVLPRDFHPDSGTVWIDHDAENADERYKLLIREPDAPRVFFGARLFTSPDGLHWQDRGETGPMGDRSTLFYNPFRRVWVQSIRDYSSRGRCRRYWEDADFVQSGRWEAGQPLHWAAADCLDHAGDSPAQLYNLDAVAYESLLIGLHQIHKGPPNEIGEATGTPKLTELTIGFSRDGFHWYRPDRRPFIGADRTAGSWEYGYVEPSGGVCLVVGDELWFYYSAYAGDPVRVARDWKISGMYANGAVGLARLRRDGFASLRAGHAGADARTRPVTFTGDRLFVNANTAGAELRVEILGADGQPVPGGDAAHCRPFMGNSTCAEIDWEKPGLLAALRGQPVRFRFCLDRGDLYAFWVTAAPTGASGGYLGAGRPGCAGNRDL
jgi:hypothetical protein